MLLQRGPLGVVIQYLPFSLTTSTPFMVALSRPFPDEANDWSAKRQGRSFVQLLLLPILFGFPLRAGAFEFAV
jgi:hypothetical protein